MPITNEDVTAVAKKILADSAIADLKLTVVASVERDETRAAQRALESAQKSAYNALLTAAVMNRVDKASKGVKYQGAYGAAAQDSLRAALLFAAAGLDQALKRLVVGALPLLVAHDRSVNEKFESWAAAEIRHADSGGVDPRSLISLLIGTGDSPRDILVGRYADFLVSDSAQSAQRVDDLASILGVVDVSLRKRTKPTNDKRKHLERAFKARNEIIHELDLVKPSGAERRVIERSRTSRRFEDMRAFSHECLDVTQCIINDVVTRLSSAGV